MNDEVADIVDYLKSVGFSNIPDDSDDIFKIEVFERNDIKIEYDTIFGNSFMVYKNDEQVLI